MKNRKWLVLAIIVVLLGFSAIMPIEDDSGARLNDAQFDSKSELHIPGTKTGGVELSGQSPVTPVNNFRLTEINYSTGGFGGSHISTKVQTSGPDPSDLSKPVKLKFYVDGQLTNTTDETWSGVKSNHGKLIKTTQTTGSLFDSDLSVNSGLSIEPNRNSVIKACIDPSNTWPETDETDNCVEKMLNLPTEDFRNDDGTSTPKQLEVDGIDEATRSPFNFWLSEVNYSPNGFGGASMNTKVHVDGPTPGNPNRLVQFRFYVDGQITSRLSETWTDINSNHGKSVSTRRSSGNLGDGTSSFDGGLDIVPNSHSMIKACVDTRYEWREYDEMDNCIEYKLGVLESTAASE